MADTWDVRILTASYRREGPQEEPVIELFGRTREGRSIVAGDWGFKPYFYAVRRAPGRGPAGAGRPPARRTPPSPIGSSSTWTWARASASTEPRRRGTTRRNS